MKTTIFAAILASVLLPKTANPQSVSVDGGRSPNAKYEVRIVRTPRYSPDKDGSEYFLRVQSSKGHSILTLDGSGYRRFENAAACCKVCWDKSSQFVAITDQDTRHSTKLQIAAFTETGPVRLALPDYAQNALGKVGALEVDRACVTTLNRWEGDDLMVEFSFDANGYHTYTFKVVFHVRREPSSAPSVGLKSVTKTGESDG